MLNFPTASGLLVPSSFATRMIAHHEVVDLPGGPFVEGAVDKYAPTPQWIRLSPFSLGTTAVTQGQYEEGLYGNKGDPKDHPATYISWDIARDYFLEINKREKVRLRFPTAEEREYAARGPAVNLLEVMEEEGVKPSDFVEFAENRFENFVREIKMGAHIFTDPKGRRLRKILQEGQPLYAWRVYGTPSGHRFTGEEAWFDREDTASADWGPANGYGLKGMTGRVFEWVGGMNMDWCTGGLFDRCSRFHYFRNDPDDGPVYSFSYNGFRVAAASQDSKPKARIFS